MHIYIYTYIPTYMQKRAHAYADMCSYVCTDVCTCACLHFSYSSRCLGVSVVSVWTHLGIDGPGHGDPKRLIRFRLQGLGRTLLEHWKVRSAHVGATTS